MFCLTEESLANHMGERHLREDINALEEQKKENDELQKQISMQSEEGKTGEEDDPDKIVVVQVGEKPKEYKPYDSGKFERQQTPKEGN